MKHYKLPFSIKLERKYNDINIDNLLSERDLFKEEHKNQTIAIDNNLHIEFGKFKTFDIDHSEIMDLAMRFALGKHEFRKLAAQVIDLKKIK